MAQTVRGRILTETVSVEPGNHRVSPMRSLPPGTITPQGLYVVVTPHLHRPMCTGIIGPPGDETFILTLKEGIHLPDIQDDLHAKLPRGCFYTWATAAGLDPHNLTPTPELAAYVAQPARQSLTPPQLQLPGRYASAHIRHRAVLTHPTRR